MDTNYKNIAPYLGTLYEPISALVIYQTKEEHNKQIYVEHFDMDANGNPINAHPLTVREAEQLSKLLNTKQLQENACFLPNGILPTNVLHINSNENGHVIWFTKPQKRQLFFVKSLGISNGKANVPTLLWKATKTELSVFALKGTKRPTLKTKLFYAPFFNVYESGTICMGTVDIQSSKAQSLEEFIYLWENYFFNSYFSHLLDNYNPISDNLVNVWNDLMNTEKPFPKDVLKPNNKTLQNII
ncbi:PRTRC system protein B [Aquimarina longa]|uniref:PRTRC system protein B n=1 Tax=Aquimarina longa TaxID=1080221 RepID=UPI0007857787|nr:PRTRC system protein B [Aquimarina longa]